MKDKAVEDIDIEIDNFDLGSKPELDIICNMIFLLPLEYDTVIEVIEEEGLEEELAIS